MICKCKNCIHLYESQKILTEKKVANQPPEVLRFKDTHGPKNKTDLSLLPGYIQSINVNSATA